MCCTMHTHWVKGVTPQLMHPDHMKLFENLVNDLPFSEEIDLNPRFSALA